MKAGPCQEAIKKGSQGSVAIRWGGGGAITRFKVRGVVTRNHIMKASVLLKSHDHGTLLNPSITNLIRHEDLLMA